MRVGLFASGTSGVVPLDIALEVAEQVGMPLMAHIDHPPPSYEEVLARLRPGDVLTHAFRPFPNTPATAQGTVKKVVLEARERGVLFDIGHGKGSFAFKTARAMLANGFYPDTISSDIHQLCIDGPAFDQVTTMSKFLCMGMSLPDVIAASTVNAAMALRRPELGSLKPGCVGDATLISVRQGQFDYVDVVGEHLTGDRKIVSEGGRDRRPLVAPEIGTRVFVQASRTSRSRPWRRICSSRRHGSSRSAAVHRHRTRSPRRPGNWAWRGTRPRSVWRYSIRPVQLPNSWLSSPAPTAQPKRKVSTLRWHRCCRAGRGEARHRSR